MYSEILYKQDSKKKIRSWKIKVINNVIIETYGIIDGKKIENKSTIKGVNIGKSNQTSNDEQAIIEAKAKVELKLKSNYHKTIDEAKSSTYISPMLAKTYAKYKNNIDWKGNIYAQAKYDGERCLAFIENGDCLLKSRGGEIIDTCDHIREALRKVIMPGANYILDGELYKHGESFQNIHRLVTKYRKDETEKLQYVIYDVIYNAPYKNRFMSIQNLVRYANDNRLQLVKSHLVYSDKDMKNYHKSYLEDGYEGTIIRYGSNGYETNKRSKYLLKLKDFKDIKLKILNVVPMKNKPNLGIIETELNGQKFKATPKISTNEKEELLKNKDKYIGNDVEIRYFELTDDGIPRFPVAIIL